MKVGKGGKTKPSEFGFESEPDALNRIEFRGIGR